MPLAFLLAMQAAGMVVDWMGRSQQIALAQQGAQLEQQNIMDQIQTSRLQTEESSLQAMKQLRQNLGTQAAMLAARGTRSSAGSAVLIRNESISNFNADERIRRINQLANEARLKTGIQISQLHQEAYESQQKNEFFVNALKMLPTNPAAYQQAGSSFGLTRVGQ